MLRLLSSQYTHPEAQLPLDDPPLLEHSLEKKLVLFLAGNSGNHKN